MIGMTAQNDLKNTSWPGGNCPASLMQTAMAVKAQTDATFSAMPSMGLGRASLEAWSVGELLLFMSRLTNTRIKRWARGWSARIDRTTHQNFFLHLDPHNGLLHISVINHIINEA